MRTFISKIIPCIVFFVLLNSTVFAIPVTITLGTPTATLEEDVRALNSYGKEVVISGSISSGAGNQVTIIIKNPQSVKVYQNQTTSGMNGSFTFKHFLDSSAVEGQYTVLVGGFDVNNAASTNFDYKKPNPDANILSFSLEGKSATINGNTISLVLPANTVLSKAIAIFQASESSTVTVNGLVQQSGTTVNNFTNAVIYKVVPENQATLKEYTVSVVLEQKQSTNSSESGGIKISVSNSPSITPPASTTDEDNTGIKNQFTDISDLPWAKEHIERLSSQGIINGVGKDKFEPNREITREEFLKMLIIAFKLEDQSATAQFKDVNSDEWYYKYIAGAVKHEIVKGIGNDIFGIGSLISRQDMSTMAYRTAMVAGINFKQNVSYSQFSDEQQIEDYAKEPVKTLRQAGIISGTGENYFAPDKFSTRAQAAKIISLLLDGGSAK